MHERAVQRSRRPGWRRFLVLRCTLGYKTRIYHQGGKANKQGIKRDKLPRDSTPPETG